MKENLINSKYHNGFKKLSKHNINDINDDNIISQKNIIFNANFHHPFPEKLDLKDNSLEILSNKNKAKELLSNKNNDIKDNKKLGIKIESSTPNNERYKRKSAKMYIQSLFDQNQKSSSNKFILSKKLFPSRYYFYIIFVKNLDVLKKTNCFSKKFSKSYMFITKLLDIYSYFDFIR